jgi:integrase
MAGSFSTLNTARSAVSLISNNTIGDDPLIRRFCKGASVLKPPKPRYDYIWDPAPVILKLGSLFPHEDLSLEKITKKLVLLLALGSGQRCQTLASLRIPFISFVNNKMVIKVPDHLKTSAPDRFQPLLLFSRFNERANLCIVSLLEHYLLRTVELRSKDSDLLFISFKSPHKSVGVQTISRWIRETLLDCGVDNSFTAHSTRHASTSFAAKKGISIDLIKRAAGWTADSQIFAKFYNRPIINPDAFSNAIMLN